MFRHQYRASWLGVAVLGSVLPRILLILEISMYGAVCYDYVCNTQSWSGLPLEVPKTDFFAKMVRSCLKKSFFFHSICIRNGHILKPTYGIPKLSSWLVKSLIFHNLKIFNWHLTTHFEASFLRKRKTTYKVKTSAIP